VKRRLLDLVIENFVCGLWFRGVWFCGFVVSRFVVKKGWGKSVHTFSPKAVVYCPGAAQFRAKIWCAVNLHSNSLLLMDGFNSISGSGLSYDGLSYDGLSYDVLSYDVLSYDVSLGFPMCLINVFLSCVLPSRFCCVAALRSLSHRSRQHRSPTGARERPVSIASPATC
jgi:hypothetical protein